MCCRIRCINETLSIPCDSVCMPPDNISVSVNWNVPDSKWGAENSREVNEATDESTGVRDDLGGKLKETDELLKSLKVCSWLFHPL